MNRSLLLLENNIEMNGLKELLCTQT